MRSLNRQLSMFCCVALIVAVFLACGKPKEGKVVVSDQEFSIRQDTNHSWVIDAKGKIKNIGEVDVKNVSVTGYCRSCGEIIVNGAWFISDLEKTNDEKDTIAYLPAGAEEDFSFKGVAYLMDQKGTSPDKMPDRLECVILSFETVEK